MPIFEYKCDDCGTSFEKLVRGNGGQSGLTCPSCGQPRVTQQLSTFAAHSSQPSGRGGSAPMCPSGACCNPGACGLN